MITREHYYIRKERQRKEALASHNAQKYAILCDELGIKPENIELYDLGEMELNQINDTKNGLESRLLSRKRKVSMNTYMKFLKEADSYPIDTGVWPDTKREILTKYFPRRFRKNGVQDISKIDDLRVGCLFNKMVEYARRVVDD